MAASIHIFFLVMLCPGFLFIQTIKNASSCIDFERESLLSFKQGLTDPSDLLSSWVGNDCCGWTGVTCNNITGNVIELKLRNEVPEDPDFVDAPANALGGQISSSLLELKQLRYLDLSMNNFEGTPIPNFFGSIEELRYLNLSSASFGGTLPSNLGNLSSLQYLDLSSFFNESKENDLNWLPNLTSLKYLNLGNVDLSTVGNDWLEAVNMLPSLQELHLPTCGLSTLPLSASVVNLTSLSVLDLSNNGFNSSIPSWIFNLTSLVYLDLSTNSLHSVFPDEFAQLKYLEHIDLSENSFIEGNLSRTLGKLCSLRDFDLSFNKMSGEITDVIDGFSDCSNPSLELLHLGYNNFNGFIPNSIGNLRNLKYFRLMGNSFSGSIPETIGNLLSLEELYLANNLMTGTIPVSLRQLSKLVYVDISKNQWTGVITEAHLSNLTSLKELSIVQSSREITLVFNISTAWLPPFKLRYIDLKSCKVGPGFPAWLRNQNELNSVAVWRAEMSGTIPKWFWELDLLLNVLDFSYNQLTGTVPNTIRFNPQAIVFLNYNLLTGPMPLLSSNVSSLHLDNNLFSGPIPEDFGERMPMLADVDLSFNSLNGSIPTSVGNLVSLLTFVVSNNRLTGHIPDCWESVLDIFVIDMSNNSLSGEIPKSFGSLIGLKFLTLSNNRLSGELPSALQNCTTMEALKLGDNRISGRVPGWIGETMPSLLILSLRSNLFSGYISSKLCNLSSLHILDLAHNNLSGSIPACVGDLIGMSSIQEDVRYEGQFVVATKGREYFYETTLYLVNSIDLSGNSLSGEVPKLTENLSKLGILNLSINHLTGKIPESISRLQRLETLDLSRNQLSGAIPQVMASITSLNHLNLSHNNLTGNIPSTNQFQTFIDPSIYEGNPALCGFPLPTKCNGDDETSNHSPEFEDDDDEDDNERVWFFISMGPGFVVGFWAVFGTLLFKQSWREAYYKFFDDMKDRLIVTYRRRRMREARGT
ncbi:receptor-like protein EIX1 [Tripterygium wilfordii]|uniref:receptor-like protein EIX1 n=1 Tax=Tripterygium wilfordii TaxID=458696 RepID=UPI0018F7E9D8|nr:receptor-like protein EIX1 [Tripterygium wilfordii]